MSLGIIKVLINFEPIACCVLFLITYILDVVVIAIKMKNMVIPSCTFVLDLLRGKDIIFYKVFQYGIGSRLSR